MRAPRWKLMICIGLERLLELPIIQAPKRNSKLHNEMWMNPFFANAFLARAPNARRFTRLGREEQLRRICAFARIRSRTLANVGDERQRNAGC
jgi:hypothetical protein